MMPLYLLLSHPFLRFIAYLAILHLSRITWKYWVERAIVQGDLKILKTRSHISFGNQFVKKPSWLVGQHWECSACALYSTLVPGSDSPQVICTSLLMGEWQQEVSLREGTNKMFLTACSQYHLVSGVFSFWKCSTLDLTLHQYYSNTLLFLNYFLPLKWQNI